MRLVPGDQGDRLRNAGTEFKQALKSAQHKRNAMRNHPQSWHLRMIVSKSFIIPQFISMSIVQPTDWKVQMIIVQVHLHDLRQ